jgi:hypothetical protein
MHPLDIPMAESGGPFRPLRPAPGLLRQVLCRLFFHPKERLEAVAVDQPLTAGEILPAKPPVPTGTSTRGHLADHQLGLEWS